MVLFGSLRVRFILVILSLGLLFLRAVGQYKIRKEESDYIEDIPHTASDKRDWPAGILGNVEFIEDRDSASFTICRAAFIRRLKAKRGGIWLLKGSRTRGKDYGTKTMMVRTESSRTS